MNPSSYRELILYDLSETSNRIFNSFNDDFWSDLPSFLLIGVLFSFLTSWDFVSLLKRSLIGVIALSIAIPMFAFAADYGFIVGSKVISKNNIVVKSWYSATSVASTSFKLSIPEEKRLSYADVLRNPSTLTTLKFIKQKTSGPISTIPKDILGFVFWMISNMSLWFVKVTFTLAYWLPQCLLPIIILVSVLPVASKAFEGVLVSIVWIGVTPIVIAGIMELFTGILESGGEHSPSLIAKGFIAIIFSLYLIGSMVLAKAIIDGDTISKAVSNVGQSYGTGMVMGATSAVSGFVKKRAAGFLFSNGSGKEGALRKMATFPMRTKTGSFNKLAETIDAKQSKPMDILRSKVGNNKESIGMKNAKSVSSILSPLKTKKLEKDYTQAAYLMKKDGLTDQPVTSDVIERYKKTDRWKADRYENNESSIRKAISNPTSSISKVPRVRSTSSRSHAVPEKRHVQNENVKYSETNSNRARHNKSYSSHKNDSSMKPLFDRKFDDDKSFKNIAANQTTKRRNVRNTRPTSRG